MFQSAHASVQGYAAQEAKATYRLTLRSVDGANFNSAITFRPTFDNQALLPTDNEYQVAVESFVLWNADPNQLNVPVCITAVDTSIANSYDSLTKGRGRTLLTTTVGAGQNGFNQAVTKDTIGIPCSSLGLFSGQSLTLQMQSLNGTAFAEAYFGTDAGGADRKYGEWAITLVLYPL